MSNTKNKVKLLNMYILSTLMCFASGQQGRDIEANALSLQALGLMASDDTLAFGSVIESALEELHNIGGRGPARVGENITGFLSDITKEQQDNQLTQSLLRHIATFYPQVMATVRLPHAAAAAAAAAPMQQDVDLANERRLAAAATAASLAQAPREEDRVRERDEVRKIAAELTRADATMVLGVFMSDIIDDLEILPKRIGTGEYRDMSIGEISKKFLNFILNNQAQANTVPIKALRKYIRTYYIDVLTAIRKMMYDNRDYTTLRTSLPAQFPDVLDDEDDRPQQQQMNIKSDNTALAAAVSGGRRRDDDGDMQHHHNLLAAAAARGNGLLASEPPRPGFRGAGGGAEGGAGRYFDPNSSSSPANRLWGFPESAHDIAAHVTAVQRANEERTGQLRFARANKLNSLREEARLQGQFFDLVTVQKALDRLDSVDAIRSFGQEQRPNLFAAAAASGGMRRETSAEREANEAATRHFLEEEERQEAAARRARREQMAEEAERETQRMLQREKDERLVRQRSAEIRGAAAAEALDREYRERAVALEQAEIRDHEHAVALNILETLGIPDHDTLHKLLEFSYGRPNAERARILNSIHQLQVLPRGLLGDVSNVVLPLNPETIGRVEEAARSIVERVAREAREAEERLQRDREAREREQARLEQERRVARAHGSWIVEAVAGVAGLQATDQIIFTLPEGFHDEAKAFVGFFMERVQPKLLALLKAGKINAHQYNKVLRAVSMATSGLEFKEEYRQVVQRLITAAGPGAQLGYVSLLDAINARPGVPDTLRALNNRPVLHPIARPEDMRAVAQFMTLHTEEEHGTVVNQLIRLAKPTKTLVQLKKEYVDGLIDSKVAGMSAIIETTFKLLLEKGAEDEIWVQAIRSFDADNCYDGTSRALNEGLDPIVRRYSDVVKGLPKLYADVQGLEAKFPQIKTDFVNLTRGEAEKQRITRELDGTFNALVSVPLNQFFDRISGEIAERLPQHWAGPEGISFKILHREEAEYLAQKAQLEDRLRRLMAIEEQEGAGEQTDEERDLTEAQDALRLAETDLELHVEDPLGEAAIEQSLDRARTRLRMAPENPAFQQRVLEATRKKEAFEALSLAEKEAQSRARMEILEGSVAEKRRLLAEAEQRVRPRAHQEDRHALERQQLRSQIEMLPLQTRAERDAVLRQLEATYAQIRRIFERGTLEDIGIKTEVAQAIRAELGWKPGTRECLYTDAEILEIMFWIAKRATHSLMPPSVAEKYGIEQILPGTRP